MDKIKLSFPSKENYKWVINNNTVVCIMNCFVNLYVSEHNYENKIKQKFPKVKFNYDGFWFNVAGVAKLNPNDEYDEVLGKHLAEARAKEKAYSVANRVACLYHELICADLAAVEDFTEDTCYQYEHEGNHINYLITGKDYLTTRKD